MDATNLYGHSLSQMLPYNEIQFEKGICLGDLLNTPDDSYIGYFIEVVSRYPDNMKKKTKTFPFCPEKEKKLILKSVMSTRKNYNIRIIQNLKS